MPQIIDLRSDTVTKPSKEMLEAMMKAEVGDDVFEGDPTVNLLQEMAARITGKEAALYTPSGTMSNLIAIKVHTQPGDEVLMETSAHSMDFEVGGAAMIAGVMTRQFRSHLGVPDVQEIADSIHVGDLHGPATTLIVLENIHNRSGGYVIPVEVHQAIHHISQARNVPIHLDGARVFNACVALGVSVREIADCCDSVAFCLSKGLGAPIGSLLCGTEEFIGKARRIRKMLGGGMRQVGFLAAAGIYALEHNIDRLAEDHARAKKLAHGLVGIPGLEVETTSPPANMLFFKTTGPALKLAEELKERGVLLIAISANRIRMVTHMDVDDAGIDHAIKQIRGLAK